MSYSQVFDTIDALRRYLKDNGGKYAKSMPFADFGKAVFGYYLFSPESGIGSVDPGVSDYQAAVNEAMPTADLVVWMMFGRELREVPTTFRTLAELNAVALADPPLVTYRLSGIPSAVDYGGAPDGISRTYTVDLTGYKKTDRSLMGAAITQYRSLDWQFLVGVMDASLIPRPPTVSVPAVSRPAL